MPELSGLLVVHFGPIEIALALQQDPQEYDRDVYKRRNLIERAFNRLKHWRGIATRYDRRSLYFLAALHLAAAVIWSM